MPVIWARPGEDPDILCNSAPRDGLGQISGDPLVHGFERQIPAVDPPLHTDDVQPEPGPDRFGRDVPGPERCESPLELGDGLPPAQLAEIAALRGARAI